VVIFVDLQGMALDQPEPAYIGTAVVENTRNSCTR
jgi:hypothetical protein